MFGDAQGKLAEVRRSMAEVAAAFDPALITAEQARRVVEEASAVEKMAATVCALRDCFDVRRQAKPAGPR